MPRLKDVDKPYEEDIEGFEQALAQKIDEVSDEIINDKEYKMEEVTKLLENKTWVGLFNRLEEKF